jgi:thioredoxin reductase (NADPH)
MVGNVQSHIKKLNWGYKVALVEAEVQYKNKLAEIVDAHRVKLTDAKGNSEEVTAKYILIAVGGRPTLPEQGHDLVITSDDLFSLKKGPGKTLVVGASYVALECAGFLTGMGYDTTVMVRSILLRGFDQEIANKLGSYMEERGTKFIRGCVPSNIEATADGQRKVTWKVG